MRDWNRSSEHRAEALGQYIVDHKATVRMTAAATGISKSTVHKEVSHRLQETDYGLYLRVREVLEQNKSERHIRGGIATREKYRRLAEVPSEAGYPDRHRKNR